MMVRAITRRWPAWAVMSTPLLIAQPLPLAAQTDARAQREVRVLETVEPSTGLVMSTTGGVVSGTTVISTSS